MEKFLINKIGTISFILGIIVIYLGFCKSIDLKFTITTIGGIFAFWYGYKKYERDKELDIIEKYTKFYDDINKEIEYSEKKVEKLINLWYKEFFLVSKGYISDELWNEWQHWITLDIDKIILSEVKQGINGDAEFPFILTIQNFLGYNTSKVIRYKNQTFIEFIVKIITYLDGRYKDNSNQKIFTTTFIKASPDLIKKYEAHIN